MDVQIERRKLLAKERKQKILEWVAAEEAIDFASLAKFLGVSVMTVRRDVQNLVDQGYMTLTRGGASAQLSRSLDILVNPRASDSSVAKARIGEFAARNMTAGHVIFVGTGSTTAQFIQFLNPDQNLTVITPSLPHASFLASRGVRVISTGGLVETEDLAQSGAIAAWSISRYNADMAVIGAQGISRKTGLSEVNPEIAELNRLLSEHAEKTWVLADLSKAGAKSAFHTLDLDQVDTIVTTHDGVDLFEFEVAGACHVISAPLSPFSFQGNP
jgi:DeoR family transcriptional regulator, fructose operon transcriptional repressor